MARAGRRDCVIVDHDFDMCPLFSDQLREYLDSLVPPRSPEVIEMEAYARAHDFPIIGPAAGQCCYVMTRLLGARRVFELGSGYGYSTAWFARAVHENGGGEVHHVVWDQELSSRARRHLRALALDHIVQFHVGEAVGVLRNARDAFDIVLMDIEKTAYPDALPVIATRLRRGGLLIVDNMLWSGRVFDEQDQSPETTGIRSATTLLTSTGGWISTLVPIRDGLMLAMRT
jgi:caffeoyl-CoA O-methyltransferase